MDVKPMMMMMMRHHLATCIMKSMCCRQNAMKKIKIYNYKGQNSNKKYKKNYYKNEISTEENRCGDMRNSWKPCVLGL